MANGAYSKDTIDRFLTKLSKRVKRGGNGAFFDLEKMGVAFFKKFLDKMDPVRLAKVVDEANRDVFVYNRDVEKEVFSEVGRAEIEYWDEEDDEDVEEPDYDGMQQEILDNIPDMSARDFPLTRAVLERTRPWTTNDVKDALRDCRNFRVMPFWRTLKKKILQKYKTDFR
jgi:hypothetical protein